MSWRSREQAACGGLPQTEACGNEKGHPDIRGGLSSYMGLRTVRRTARLRAASAFFLRRTLGFS